MIQASKQTNKKPEKISLGIKVEVQWKTDERGYVYREENGRETWKLS